VGGNAGENITSDGNIIIGYYAGTYQTTLGNRLIIDNQFRGSAALELTSCLIYGVFDAVPANQSLRVNASLFVSQMKSGATQGAAGAVAGELWFVTGTNVVMMGV
jgi:hypothetical protein